MGYCCRSSRFSVKKLGRKVTTKAQDLVNFPRVQLKSERHSVAKMQKYEQGKNRAIATGATNLNSFFSFFDELDLGSISEKVDGLLNIC